MESSEIIVYGPNGEAYTRSDIASLSAKSSEQAVSETGMTHGQIYGSFVHSLLGLGGEPIFRASDPLRNHQWVYAAAMSRAVNLAQAPLRVMRETEEEVARRRAASRQKNWSPRAGSGRSSFERHLDWTASQGNGRFRGAKIRALEPDYDHPLWPVLRRPNPLVSSQANLITLTSIWISIRGEAQWICTGEDGARIAPGDTPTEIWPVDPGRLEPVYDRNQVFIGHFYTACEGIPVGRFPGNRIALAPHEVVSFRYPDPRDLSRGLSPLTAMASGINLDMLSDAHNQALLQNGAEPGGTFTTPMVLDDEELDRFQERLESRHAGPFNVRRHLILQGGWERQTDAMTPTDMQFAEGKDWNRQGVLSGLRVPKATLGITDDLNYATQLAQDRILWEKSLFFDVMLIERELDVTLLRGDTDDTLAAFDLSGIQALRAGLEDSVRTAERLSGGVLHVPPKVALSMVGIPDIPEYAGDDVAFANGLQQVPVEAVLEAAGGAGEISPAVPPAEDVVDPELLSSINGPGRKRAKSDGFWDTYIEALDPHEAQASVAWRQWVGQQRRSVVTAFEEQAQLASASGGKKKEISIELVLPALAEMQRQIALRFRPVYGAEIQTAGVLVTSEVGGIVVFELDDPLILQAVSNRMQVLISGPPVTLQAMLRSSLSEGILAGETVQELRARIEQIFGVVRGDAKTLQIARTESAGFMSSVRHAMHTLQQIERFDWLTAGDEVVRETHRFFGAVGTQPAGTNYLELPGYAGTGTGVLEYPGDHRASGNEVISCRCVQTIA